MSQQNKTTLQQSINTQLADNSTGDISAADIRSNMINITDSLVFNNEDQSIVGSIELTGDVTASAFVGDGSALTGISTEWDGSRNGNAEITGSLTVTGTNANILALNKIGVGTDNPIADIHVMTSASPTLLLEDTTNSATLEIKTNNTNQTITSTGRLTIDSASGLTIAGSGNVNIQGDVTASAFVGDGSALTGIASGNAFPYNGAAEITGSLTVSGSGNTNILGDLYVYGASPAQQFFSTGYDSNRVVSNWYSLTGPNLHTEIDPGNIKVTSNFTDFLTLRDNGTTKGLSRETATGRITSLAFETGTVTLDGVVTVPKDVTGTVALELKGYTVATLPTGAVGDRAYVTDASAPSFLTSVTGGGAITSPVFHNGTTWVCG